MVEAIKLYLDAPGFVFVIGYDRDVISDAILDVKQYGDSMSGHHQLEKVVSRAMPQSDARLACISTPRKPDGCSTACLGLSSSSRQAAIRAD